MPRDQLVGAGLTSEAIACRLSDLPVKLSCWNRARKPGSEYIFLYLPLALPPPPFLCPRSEQKPQVYFIYLVFLHRLKVFQ